MTYIPSTTIISGSNRAIVDMSGSLHSAMVQNTMTDVANTFSASLVAPGQKVSGSISDSFQINSIIVWAQSTKTFEITVQQMLDPTNTGIQDKFYVSASTPDSRVFASISPYYTIIAENTDTATGSIYVAVVQMPVMNVLPRALAEQGGMRATIDMNVVEDPLNSSIINLNAAGTAGSSFTGSAASTLGVVGLQWSLKTDQNATVYIEESPDGTNWDISYPFDYIASEGGVGETVQASQAYWRIRVENLGIVATTYFRLEAVLCPIAVPLPSSLSPDSRLKVEGTLTGKENADRHVWVSPTNNLGVNNSYRLVGTNFDGIVKDTNFWSESVANGGAVTQSGEIKLQTNGAANGSAQYTSVRRARFVVGSANQFVGAFKFNTAGTPDNIRRLGAYDDNNGYFFELSESVFGVGSRKDGVDTFVTSSNFNGHYGTNFTPASTNYYKYDIEWTPLGAFYYVNGKLLHKNVGGHFTNILTQPIRFENINNNGSVSDVIMDCLGVVIIRLGELTTNPTYKYIAGAQTGVVLKVGAGDLHTVVNTNNAGSITLWDNTAASGDIIAIIDLAKVLGTLTFNAPFSNGLTITSTGACFVTITYE